MKNLRQMCAVTILIVVLAMSAVAGQIQCPGAPAPGDTATGGAPTPGGGDQENDGDMGGGGFASLLNELLDLVF